MKVGDKIRMALRSFLQISEPGPQTFRVPEQLDFNGKAIEHRLWYHGDAAQLGAFYRQLSDQSTQRFWAAVSTRGREIRKVHTGLPRMTVNTLTALILADLNEFVFQDPAQGELWVQICGENKFNDLLSDALRWCMVIGDGAFKLSLDPALSQRPILEWWDGDRMEVVLRRGRIVELVFHSYYREGCCLEEHYGYGYVRYRLFQNRKEVPLNTLDETAHLQDISFDGSFMLAVPMRIRASDRFPGRGESFFAGKTDAFDALDEAWSQWMQAMRAARPREYIPTNLIPRDQNTGLLLRPNAFDNQFIQVEGDMTEGAGSRITLDQAAFYAEQYNSTYVTALDLALQGLISPSTLGIDTKKLDNAEAQREKEKTTLYTRQEIITKLSDALAQLVDVTLRAVAVLEHRPPEQTEVSVTFGEYASPSFESVVETLSNPNTPMSVEAKVDELWGDTRDEAWKQAEVRRIQREQGFEALEEPSVGAEGGAS